MKNYFFIAVFFISIAVCSNCKAQLLPRKPKNASQLAGMIINEQKDWQQQQLPKNSVQYKLNPPHSYTYTFNQQQKPLVLNIKTPEHTTAYYYLSTGGHTISHPYLKYYPGYKGKLSFNKKFVAKTFL